MKTIITIVVTIAVTIGIIYAAGGVFAGASSMPEAKPTPVRLNSPERGMLVEFISAPGTVEPKRKVSISARVAARIIELPFDEGEPVTKGNPDSNAGQPPSVLVKLDATELEAALHSAQARYSAQLARIEVEKAQIAGQRANLKATEIQLEQAKRDLARNQALLETKDVSPSVVDDLKSTVAELGARIESSKHSLIAADKNLIVMSHNIEEAQADIDRAKDNLSYSTIVSPMDGIVTKVNTEVGELAVTGTMNNPGTVILEVADLSRMILKAQVDEADIGQVALGQRANVRIQAYSDRIFDGTVDHIALKATDQPSKHFEVEILLDTKGQRIYSGLTADVDIETKTHENVLKVPSQAVLGRSVDSLPVDVRKDNKLVQENKTVTPVIYRIIDGKAVVTPVRIGASDASHTVILEGIAETDRIIIGPYKVLESVRHDQKVVDENEAPQATTAPDESSPENPGRGPRRIRL